MANNQITQMLMELRRGDSSAVDRLLPLVHDHLRGLARRYLEKERGHPTVRPTDLANDAYLRLVNEAQVDWQGRSHFYAVAARSIRQILVDHAEARRAQKRGGGRARLTLRDELHPAREESTVDVLDLEQALLDLARLDARQAQVVELRFYGGLSVKETGVVLGISEKTVKNDWRFAKSWLRKRLTSCEP
ncbi:MAG: sigma-70 family RNA polymerase sigma factor [Planctomycetota bacterium]